MNSEKKFLIAAGLLVAAVATADVTVGKWIFKTNSAELPVGFTLKADNVTTTTGATPPGMVPIGGMVAVMPSTHITYAWQPPEPGVIKDGFMRADGHTITTQNVADGSLFPAGTALPNMVGSFPKGAASTSGTVTAAQKLIATSIPQISTTYTPAGTNASSAVSGTTNIGHTHGSSTVTIDKSQWNSNQTAHSHAISPGIWSLGSSAGGSYDYSTIASTRPAFSTTGTSTATVAWSAVNATGSADGHTLGATNISLTSGSAAAQTFTGTQATITVGTAAGSQTTIPDPANVTVVWVIRVK